MKYLLRCNSGVNRSYIYNIEKVSTQKEETNSKAFWHEWTSKARTPKVDTTKTTQAADNGPTPYSKAYKDSKQDLMPEDQETGDEKLGQKVQAITYHRLSALQASMITKEGLPWKDGVPEWTKLGNEMYVIAFLAQNQMLGMGRNTLWAMAKTLTHGDLFDSFKRYAERTGVPGDLLIQMKEGDKKDSADAMLEVAYFLGTGYYEEADVIMERPGSKPSLVPQRG